MQVPSNPQTHLQITEHKQTKVCMHINLLCSILVLFSVSKRYTVERMSTKIKSQYQNGEDPHPPQLLRAFLSKITYQTNTALLYFPGWLRKRKFRTWTHHHRPARDFRAPYCVVRRAPLIIYAFDLFTRAFCRH